MRKNRFLLGISSIGLVLGALASASVAYGEGKHEGKHEGSTSVQKGVAHPVKLSNLSDQPLKEIEIKFSGKDAKDFVQTNNCGEKLDGKASCTINVTFAPKTPGSKTAAMEVHTSGGDQIVYLTGTGT